jgi:hypothetical protein
MGTQFLKYYSLGHFLVLGILILGVPCFILLNELLLFILFFFPMRCCLAGFSLKYARDFEKKIHGPETMAGRFIDSLRKRRGADPIDVLTNWARHRFSICRDFDVQ